jgi:hypothetical protein
MGTFSPTQPVSRGELVDKVTQLFGLKGDGEMRTVATQFLDDSIKEMNSYLFEFNKRRQAGVTLVQDQADYELEGTPYKEVQAFLVATANNNEEPPLYYLPYVQFKRIYNVENSSIAKTTGTPYAYTLRNIEEDGKVTLYPAPGSTTATNYTLTVEYYIRIPLLSDLASDEKKLEVPQEVETALLFAAQKRMCIHINGPSHQDVVALDGLENRAFSRLKSIDKYHPDANQRFRLIDRSRRDGSRTRSAGRGVMYIKI